MTTLTRSVSASNDDAQETGGTMNLAASNLNASSATQGIGLRFTNITIPANATINSATLTLNITSTSYDSPDVVIRGSGEADSTTFTATDYDLTNRYKTAVSVNWAAGDIGSGAKNTPDLAAILREILAMPGWASGNDISFYLTANAGSVLRVYAYENGSAIPQLAIDYTEPAAGGQPPRTMHQFRMRQ